MAQRRLKYSEFWDRINVDSFEEAIEWTPEYSHNDNDIGFCPFPENHSHGDTTGKFAIQREKRVYNCWVCGGGSLLSLVMELKDFDLETATEWLFQFTDEDDRSDTEFVDDFLDAFRDVQVRSDTLPYFNERVLEKFNDPIALSEMPVYVDGHLATLIPWTWDRCVSDEVVERYDVRYSANNYRPSPGKGKFADEPDYEGPAVIFPHHWQGCLVGWQARWLDPDRPEWVPKYTMTTDFPKETTIYGWDQLEAIDQPTVIVESVPSTLFIESMGYPSVATFGSSVNEAQMRLLRRLTGGVILARDNDEAGVKWERSLTEYLKRYIRVWHLPIVSDEAGADIGDLASTDSPREEVEALISRAYEPGIDL